MLSQISPCPGGEAPNSENEGGGGGGAFAWQNDNVALNYVGTKVNIRERTEINKGLVSRDQE